MPEQRIVLRNCGVIDPKDINTYLEREGFKTLKKVLEEMTPEGVIEELKHSGLRGRGGAGFPTGLKLELAKSAPGEEKYIICNADEGEVGTFKDRYILLNDPFSVIEGMAIAGYAVGARRGYIYLRAEYSYLLETLLNAIEQAKERGFLNLDLEVQVGAGGYICGEETALIESLEGGRGEPRYRPPFPPSQGLWRKPTVVNNVETLANIPQIVLNGAEWFRKIGTEKSPGTKVFSVCGDVQRPGVYELVMGSRLRELVEEIALAEEVKMVQVGGAAGRVIPSEKMDIPLSFETVLGSGGVIVFNRSRDVVEVALKTMEFFEEESCGKCVPCREGTRRTVEILRRILEGGGRERDLKLLEDLSETMMLTSLCGLGQTAPNFIVDTLSYFREEYEAQIGRG